MTAMMTMRVMCCVRGVLVMFLLITLIFGTLLTTHNAMLGSIGHSTKSSLAVELSHDIRKLVFCP